MTEPWWVSLIKAAVIVNLIMVQAIREKASDIHIEPFRTGRAVNHNGRHAELFDT